MEVNKVVHGGQTSQKEIINKDTIYNIKAVEINNLQDIDSDNKEFFTREEIEEKVEELNKQLKNEGVYAIFEVHNELKDKIMIKLVDKETDKVVKEIPPHQIIDMIAEFMKQAGIIVDKKV